ncbi:MAG: ATP-binding protein, partial [Spirochaetales bacterium]|nr:ATP-binding protein [Spirochaetales bacterium]
MFENEVIEFKEKLNDKLEREVVAFLNTTHGGSIYIGIADDGTAVGVDGLDSKQKEIKNRLKNNISPSTVGLFEIATPVIDGKQCIQVIVSGGNQQPYYIKKFGMSTEGCFFRVGSTTEKMTDGMMTAAMRCFWLCFGDKVVSVLKSKHLSNDFIDVEFDDAD